MASIEKRERNGRVTWRAHFRDPSGKQRNRTFARKLDATNFLTTVESTKLAGSYIDPAAAKVTVKEWSKRWLAGKVNLKASTRARYTDALNTHILPRWGKVKLGDVTHEDVQAWVATLCETLAPASVVKVYGVLSQMLSSAVTAQRLVRNPAKGVNLPRIVETEQRYLTHQQVDALAAAVGVYRLVVLMLAYTGLRFGEMAALRVGRLHLLRRRAEIAESVTEVNGKLVWGTPKGHEKRKVPLPRFLADELAAHVAGKAPGDLVFPAVKGGALRVRVLRRAAFDAAADSIGVPGLHPHELRHTAASLAIACGADVKVVQQMLGHKSATMTLDLYGHLMPDRLDEVADALDTARGAAVAQVLPRPEVVDLEAKRREAAGQ